MPRPRSSPKHGAVKPIGTRVAVTAMDGGSHLITKLVGLSDGGFAVTVPYHGERQGFLFKHRVDYGKLTSWVPLAEVTRYTADDRVKLSLHLDGFVQFSGERPGRIVSGRQSDGTPKGLGLIANQLTTPLSTGGPTFAITAWGIEGFQRPKGAKLALTFGDSDVYYRDCAQHEWNGYIIEGFVYPRSFLSQGLLQRGTLVLKRRFPNYQEIPRESGLILPTRQPLHELEGAVFDLTLIDVGSPYLVIGLLVSRSTFGTDSLSGFTMHSPSDMREALAAVYPNPFEGADVEAGDLNYQPASEVPTDAGPPAASVE